MHHPLYDRNRRLVVAAPDGGTLVVVGDVSGKGLRAAMVVSVVIGALLNRRSSRPGEVLAELNRAITGQLDGGFVTCLAVLLEPGGRIVAANAGHVRPYTCGREVEVPDGLPLGIVAEAGYEEAEWRLDEGAMHRAVQRHHSRRGARCRHAGHQGRS